MIRLLGECGHCFELTFKMAGDPNTKKTHVPSKKNTEQLTLPSKVPCLPVSDHKLHSIFRSWREAGEQRTTLYWRGYSAEKYLDWATETT